MAASVCPAEHPHTHTWPLTPGPAVVQPLGPTCSYKAGMCGPRVGTAGPTQAILLSRWESLPPPGSLGVALGDPSSLGPQAG